MPDLLVALLIGFGAGILSGAFGIGGGVVMVPALRILLGVDGLVAVGSSLPVIFPSAITGAVSYLRAGSADWRRGLIIGVAGMPFAALGALLAERLGGTIVLGTLVVVIGYAAVDTVLQLNRSRASDRSPDGSEATDGSRARWWPAALIGAVTGVYSGFLGLGGGFVIVPLLTRFERLSIKRAIGTSLVAIVLIAIPGTITHLSLGNTDLALSAALAVGIVPGALLGARITLGAHERSVRIAFAAMLVTSGVLLFAREVGWL